MRNVWKLSFVGACAAALALACGGDDNKNNNNNNGNDAGTTTDGGTTGDLFTFNGTIQGLAQAAAIGAAGDPGPVTDYRVDLVDPIKLLLSGDEAAARLGNSPVTPTAGATSTAPGTYTVTGIDRSKISAIAPGLVVNVIDPRTTGKKQTFPTSTGVVTSTGFASGATVTASAPAFIINDAFASAVAQLALGAGKTFQDLGTAGSIFVLALDRTGATPVPIAGVKLDPAALGAKASQYKITYVNAGATGPTAGTATDSLGLIVVTGPATGASPIALTAASTASGSSVGPCATSTSTGCLAAAQAGLSPGLNFVAPFLKQ